MTTEELLNLNYDNALAVNAENMYNLFGENLLARLEGLGVSTFKAATEFDGQITLSHIPDKEISGLQYLKSVTNLSAAYTYNLSQISGIGGMLGLEYLAFNGLSLQGGMLPIHTLRALKSLQLTNIGTIEGLDDEMTNPELITVNVSDLTITETPFKVMVIKLPKCTGFTFKNTNVSSIVFIGSTSNLLIESIDISGNVDISLANTLNNIIELKELSGSSLTTLNISDILTDYASVQTQIDALEALGVTVTV